MYDWRGPTGERFDLLVDGEYVPAASGETIPVEDPRSAEVFAEVAAGGEADVDLAVESARRGQRERQSVDAGERGRILRRMAELVREHREAFATLESHTNGKPRGQVEGEVDVCAEYFDYYAGTDKIQGEQIPMGESYVDYTIRESLGVVATPFGGYEESGIGREKGLEAVREYTQVKNVCVDISRE